MPYTNEDLIRIGAMQRVLAKKMKNPKKLGLKEIQVYLYQIIPLYAKDKEDWENSLSGGGIYNYVEKLNEQKETLEELLGEKSNAVLEKFKKKEQKSGYSLGIKKVKYTDFVPEGYRMYLLNGEYQELLDNTCANFEQELEAYCKEQSKLAGKRKDVEQKAVSEQVQADPEYKEQLQKVEEMRKQLANGNPPDGVTNESAIAEGNKLGEIYARLFAQKQKEAAEQEMGVTVEWYKAFDQKIQYTNEQAKSVMTKTVKEIIQKRMNENSAATEAFLKEVDKEQKKVRKEAQALEEANYSDDDEEFDENEIIEEDDDELEKNDEELKKNDEELKKNDKELKKNDNEIEEDDEELKKNDNEIKEDDEELNKDDDEIEEDDEIEIIKHDSKKKAPKEAEDDIIITSSKKQPDSTPLGLKDIGIVQEMLADTNKIEADSTLTTKQLREIQLIEVETFKRGFKEDDETHYGLDQNNLEQIMTIHMLLKNNKKFGLTSDSKKYKAVLAALDRFEEAVINGNDAEESRKRLNDVYQAAEDYMVEKGPEKKYWAHGQSRYELMYLLCNKTHEYGGAAAESTSRLKRYDNELAQNYILSPDYEQQIPKHADAGADLEKKYAKLLAAARDKVREKLGKNADKLASRNKKGKAIPNINIHEDGPMNNNII